MSDETQSEFWTKRAEHWQKTAPKDASASDANQLLIRCADIGPGKRCLDLASGVGDPALSIALVVGESGSVVASDASAKMLQGARDRAAELGLGNMSFENTSMEALPFEDHAFDAVTCRFGLMHAGDPLAGLREARRVLRPGGKAAFMVHGPADKNTQWTVLHLSVQAFLDIDDQARFDKHYKFSADGELAALFAEAGFTDIQDELTVTTITEDVGGNFWEKSLLRSFGNRVEGLDADALAALNEAVAEAFLPFRKNGTYELWSSNRVAWGAA